MVCSRKLTAAEGIKGEVGVTGAPVALSTEVYSPVLKKSGRVSWRTKAARPKVELVTVFTVERRAGTYQYESTTLRRKVQVDSVVRFLVECQAVAGI